MTYPAKRFSDPALAIAQVRAINAHFMAQPRRVERGQFAPPDGTLGYVGLEAYADGTTGHPVDDWVASLHGLTIRGHTIDVADAGPVPLRDVDFAGARVPMRAPVSVTILEPAAEDRG